MVSISNIVRPMQDRRGELLVSILEEGHMLLDPRHVPRFSTRDISSRRVSSGGHAVMQVM